MSKKTIMLACAAGMSTSLLVTKMKKSAEEKNMDIEIFALPASEAIDKVKSGIISCVLLGPQVRYLLEDYTKQCEPLNVPVGVIDMMDYGMMNGEKVLDTALKLIEG